jgi:toxin FitB
MYLLDTNVVSELRKISAGKAHPHVTTWSNKLDPALFYISVITIHEIEVGTLRTERRDKIQGAMYRKWLENEVVVGFSGRIVPIDFEIARAAAALHVPNPAPLPDSIIAATALVHGMTVVTRNTADFQRCGVPLLNPWLAH